jgi:hypothetical protein
MAQRNPAARVRRQFRRQALRARKVLVEGLASAAPETKADLMLDSPVDTGKLQDGWKFRKLKTGMKYTNNVAYAMWDKAGKGARFKFFWRDIEEGSMKGAKSASSKLSTFGATHGR